MSLFPSENSERDKEPGALFVLLRFVGGLAALGGGAGLGLSLSEVTCAETVGGAAWTATTFATLASVGAVTAIGAWRPKRTLLAAGIVMIAGLAAGPFTTKLQQTIELGRLKRTMRDMRDVATVIGMHQESNGSLPANQADLARVVRALDHRRPAALEDAWGTPFRYEREDASWSLTAACRCARFDAGARQDYEPGYVEDLRSDLLMTDAVFVRYPWFGNAQSNGRAQEPPPG